MDAFAAVKAFLIFFRAPRQLLDYNFWCDSVLQKEEARTTNAPSHRSGEIGGRVSSSFRFACVVVKYQHEDNKE